MSFGKAMCFSVELNFYPDTFPHAHPPTRLYFSYSSLENQPCLAAGLGAAVR